jgi:hypothetical protein
MAHISKKFWLTFPTPVEVERPLIYQMSRAFPDVIFDIRQASISEAIGIMAVLLEGEAEQVRGAADFLRAGGVRVDPIEKTVIEG